ncbi:hypothetical protein QUB80_18610 [Chlorogloeopsis sp. ULAP01]|uniref:hypothetical protein n=1 Tax=Chlorogloeopsis sp. ULAP01 TaxID=3056483 RepID=UPI0025AA36F3|nr:hypothetical protein [Chlorogloeopsis sp. ULAP01]MDM9382708.1 hypothetical protein [Chlorogloeopsis sp. ULAP01]
MTNFELNNSNIFQAEGIHLIIWAPNLIVLPIPDNSSTSNFNTFVEFNVYLINNTPNSFRLNPNETLIPELLGSDSQALQGQVVSDEPAHTEQRNIPPQLGFKFKLNQLLSKLARWFFQRKTREFDPRLIDSGQVRLATVTLRLLWQNNLLQLQVINSSSSLQIFFSLLDKSWIFNTLQTGAYQLRFIWGIPFGDSESDSDSETTQGISAEQLATKILNLRLIEPVGANKSATEVDGICFETLMPERLLTLPEKKRGVETRVQLGICITNNTPIPVRLSFFATLIPQLVGANGQPCLRGYFRCVTKRPLASDFPVIMSGENMSLFLYASLSWYKRDQFTLTIDAGDGGYWSFEALKAGVYQIQLTYINKDATEEIYDRESMNTNLVEDIWMGIVPTPKVEFRLVQT